MKKLFLLPVLAFATAVALGGCEVKIDGDDDIGDEIEDIFD